MENEIWKDIKGYEGLYLISSFGKVRSLDRIVPTAIKGMTERLHKGKILTPTPNKKKLCLVCICKNGKGRAILLHQLIARAFIPNPENKPFVRHINEVNEDNSIKNLQWITVKESNAYEAEMIKRKKKEKETILLPQIQTIIEKKSVAISQNGKPPKEASICIGNNRCLEDLDGEIWKDIQGWERIYMVSNLGRIKSVRRFINRWYGGTILKQGTTKFGYFDISISINQRKKIYFVHRLVAMAFIPNPDKKRTVNHIDRNKKNNVVSNLEWNTYRENIIHSYDSNPLAIGHGSSATVEEVRAILDIHRQTGARGVYLNKNFFPHIGMSSINKIISGTSHKKISNG